MEQNDVFFHDFHVSMDIYLKFIDLFHDKNPLHIDPVYAKQKGFSEVVMFGNILNGFLSFFIGECLPIKNVIIHHQQIKYIAPFYLLDMLTLEVKVMDVYESVNVVEFKFKFTNQKSALIAKGSIQIGLLQ